jgi:predicted permease
MPRFEEVYVSDRALFVAIAAGISSGLLFGLAPLAMVCLDSVGAALVGKGRGSTKGSSALQGSMVAFQIALTAVLLVAGGLLVRSLLNLSAVDPGFNSTNLATLRIAARGGRYPTQAEASSFFGEVVRNMEALPSVVSVAGSYGLPFPGGAPNNMVQIQDRDPVVQVVARRRTVLPAYHETMAIPLLAGRRFSEADGADKPKAMIISESMARGHWPEASPIGSTVRFWNDTWTIVGIVGDVRHTTLKLEGEPTFYVPFAQAPRRNLNLVARTEGDPAATIPLLREVVWSVDPDMPITDMSTIDTFVSQSTGEDRYRTLLTLVFGAVALILATVGIFGVTARSVAQRTREIGIRMALGARERGLVGMILRRGLVVGSAGVAAGMVAAAWGGHVLSHFLFGIEVRDPLTFGTVAVVLFIVCLVAGTIPATRAARVSPMEVLREE